MSNFPRIVEQSLALSRSLALALSVSVLAIVFRAQFLPLYFVLINVILD